MNTPNTAIETMLKFWEDPRNTPTVKGFFIKDDPPKEGEPITACMCAQGQVLHIIGGYSPEALKEIEVHEGEQEVAKLLGISLTHSILIQMVNDRRDDPSPEVLSNPEKFLGENYQKVLDFWVAIDQLTTSQAEKVYRRFCSIPFSERHPVFGRSFPEWDSRWKDPWDAVKNSNRSAIRTDGTKNWDIYSELSYAYRYATYELLEAVRNPVFVPLFENLGA